jgi:hypothetical protein
LVDECGSLVELQMANGNWFAADRSFLNLDKRNIIHFTAKNSAHSTLRIDYKEKYIEGG